ncbi:MAG: hypothetical protein ABRQ37_14260 [Candidatus Eremiobacterota bacterium]
MREFTLIIIFVLFFNFWVLYRLKQAFIEELDYKIKGLFEKHKDLFKDFRVDEIIYKDFNEKKMLDKLLNMIKDKIYEQGREIDPFDIIEEELIQLAPVGTVVYSNRRMEEAILILSRFHNDPSIYSLCTLYINLTLPGGMKKTYSLLLSHSISPQLIGK